MHTHSCNYWYFRYDYCAAYGCNSLEQPLVVRASHYPAIQVPLISYFEKHRQHPSYNAFWNMFCELLLFIGTLYIIKLIANGLFKLDFCLIRISNFLFHRKKKFQLGKWSAIRLSTFKTVRIQTFSSDMYKNFLRSILT